MKICIVTPDLVGPINNGGIGTHCYNLAGLLRDCGHTVSLLFTGPFERGTPGRWRDHYAAKGHAFLSLDDLPDLGCPLRPTINLPVAWRVYRYLAENHFDLVHFQDWQANGFFVTQAKRVLGEFAQTQLAVTLHSSTQWIAEGSLKWYDRPLEDTLTAWAERYTARHADMVISPSHYMLDWARKADWTLTDEVRVLPYCLADARPPRPTATPKPGVIAFFGRLETRKGLELFVQALKRLKQADRARLTEVLFVGKRGIAAGQDAARFIRQELRGHEIPHQIHDRLDSFEAQELLLARGAVALAPSLVDNYPFSVLECCDRGIPLLAANTGGIPEILDAAQLFEPTAASLEVAISRLLRGEITFTAGRYDAVSAATVWRALHDLPIPVAWTEPRRTAPVRIATAAERAPAISVCVPYYNYGRYLDQILESLEAQIFRDFEVVLFNDGSTDPASNAAFDAAEQRLPKSRYSFHRHENQGIGATRNAAVARATAPYLVFMDADNVAKPNMLADFFEAIQRTGADALSCHFEAFDSETRPAADEKPNHRYAPPGPCLEVAWRENVLGDANMMIRRTAFDAAGGFTTDRNASWEDWELLLRVVLRGFKLDVVPKPLFWYRVQADGLSRNTSLYRNQARIMRPYLEATDPHLRATVMTTMAMESFVMSRTGRLRFLIAAAKRRGMRFVERISRMR